MTNDPALRLLLALPYLVRRRLSYAMAVVRAELNRAIADRSFRRLSPAVQEAALASMRKDRADGSWARRMVRVRDEIETRSPLALACDDLGLLLKFLWVGPPPWVMRRVFYRAVNELVPSCPFHSGGGRHPPRLLLRLRYGWSGWPTVEPRP
jgi:hypothetical protein